jgi:AraC family transcriptional regulator, transcriptional activator of the genes for pyochelin and ferripyochelin receptors
MNFNSITFTFPLGYPEIDHGKMHYCFRVFDAATEISTTRSNEFLGVFFNLNNAVGYKIGDVLQGTIARNQYNIVYLPQAPFEFSLQKGSHAIFCIEFTLSYLKLVATNFPVLREFLTKVELRIPSVMNEVHLNITPDMRDKINDVLYNRFNGPLREDFLKIKFVDILIRCVEHSQRHFYTGLTKADIEKVKAVRTRILKDIRCSYTVSLLADDATIDERKLERGFKILFGTTVYHFLVNERMKKAVALLRDTTMPVGQIALSVGYNKLRVFSDTFKRKYGYSPATVRKKEE